MRFSNGFTKRANSVVPLYTATPNETTGDQMLLDRVRYCENLYARARLQTVFRLPEISLQAEHLDTLLDQRKYQKAETTWVMTAPLGSAKPGADIRFVSVDQWLAGYTALTGIDEPSSRLHRLLIQRIPGECGFALAFADDPEHPVACGLAVQEASVLGIFDVYTHNLHRQQGYARQIMQSLLAWGATQGARLSYLQVNAENTAAVDLYTALGFQSEYRYWYRIAQ
ncbi:MAG: GNAT family N-acetyltransferase [Pseudomonadota bacterium]